MKQHYKRNANKKVYRRKRGAKIVRKPYIGSVRTSREVGVIDTIEQPFVYRELPGLMFNTAAQVGGNYYYSNSMQQFSVGNNATVPFWELQSLMYERYIVMHSRIVVEVQNRETTNSICVCVFPSTNNLAVTTAAIFTSLQSLPGAKTFILQAASGGMSTHTFRLGCSLPRFVGEQYEEQDQWAGVGAAGSSCTNASPTAGMYWGIAYYNPTGNNTATTGGITAQVSITNKVRLNKPVRSVNSDGLQRQIRIPVSSSIPNQPPTLSDEVTAITKWLEEKTSVSTDSLTSKLVSLTRKSF